MNATEHTVEISAVDHRLGGGKAAPLAVLTRAGFAVPPGFVVPAHTYRAAATALGLDQLSVDHADEARARILHSRLPEDVVHDVSHALARLTDQAPTDLVAVRSSAITEDSPLASAAGQYDSVLPVEGTGRVCRAILHCWASLWTHRATSYRVRHAVQPPGDMAVLVQRFVDADVSGVLFTGVTSVIEASRGTGDRLVAGRLTPDRWRVRDSGIIEREGSCLSDRSVLDLHSLGQDIATTLGGPRDVEWAIKDDTPWILQARPITADVPDTTGTDDEDDHSTNDAADFRLHGAPASPGVASGPVRLVRGPGDFSTVMPGDVLVCRHTDPAWTPLFTIASAVVTEIGGVLSHAAIVAREVGIPAVLSVPRATGRLVPSSMVTVNGSAGHVEPGQPVGSDEPGPSPHH